MAYEDGWQERTKRHKPNRADRLRARLAERFPRYDWPAAYKGRGWYDALIDDVCRAVGSSHDVVVVTHAIESMPDDLRQYAAWRHPEWLHRVTKT